MKINSTQPTFKGSIYLTPTNIKSQVKRLTVDELLNDTTGPDLKIKGENGALALFYKNSRESLERALVRVFEDLDGIKIQHRPDIDTEAAFRAKSPEILKKF